jgi:hypothetical protein
MDLYIHCPMLLHGIVLNDRDNFTSHDVTSQKMEHFCETHVSVAVLKKSYYFQLLTPNRRFRKCMSVLEFSSTAPSELLVGHNNCMLAFIQIKSSVFWDITASRQVKIFT